MANRDQLIVLRDGVETWNQWLVQHSAEEIDLSGAVLSAAVLSGAALNEANLSRAVLSAANLSQANLNEANLYEANLNRADLREANLSGANLRRTILDSTNLSRAVLTAAKLSETVFGDTDLRDANGLDSCRHIGPSTIDHRTLAKSGRLPLAFLRGVGLSDRLIEYLPSLLGQALQFYACFISYSARDSDFARRLHADLQDRGVRCWFAPEDLKIGERIRHGIDEAIRVHDKLLLILSEHSVASQWVEQEVESALERERQSGKTILFPIRLDDTVMTVTSGWPRLLRNTRNVGDMRGWKDHDAYRQAFDRLLRDLRAEGGAPAI